MYILSGDYTCTVVDGPKHATWIVLKRISEIERKSIKLISVGFNGYGKTDVTSEINHIINFLEEHKYNKKLKYISSMYKFLKVHGYKSEWDMECERLWPELDWD